jgi:hypothetical protein
LRPSKARMSPEDVATSAAAPIGNLGIAVLRVISATREC